MTTFIIILAVIATIFWLVQLLSLMTMADDQFPGRFDKPIWAAILLVLTVAGAFLFVVWKISDMIRRSQARPDAGPEEVPG